MKNEIAIIIPESFSIEEAAKLREDVYRMLGKGEKYFVLDFKGCHFIDSTGLGVMVAIYKRCMEQSGSMTVKAVQPQVMKILSLTRLDKVFDIQA